MDGGHYGYRTPGSPRHWGEEVPGNVPKLVGTGNGSPCGIMVYEGELLPPEYRGAVLEVDAGTRQVNFFPLTRKGAAFRTEYKVFLARRRSVVPAGRRVRGARWVGVRGRLVRRGRRRPCLQRPDDRADLSRRAHGAQEPEGQGRLRDTRRADRRAQVAQHRHPGCGAARSDRAGQGGRAHRCRRWRRRCA